MKKILAAASIALMLGAAPQSPASAQEVIVVEVQPVVSELASHLRADPDTIPSSIDLPEKLAAVVCKATLRQLRESGGRCVAVGMSQGLIEAVRRAMREG